MVRVAPESTAQAVQSAVGAEHTFTRALQPRTYPRHYLQVSESAGPDVKQTASC